MLKFKRSFFRTATFSMHIITVALSIFMFVRYIDAFAFWRWSRSELVAALIMIVFFVGPFIYGVIFQQLYFVEFYENNLLLRNGLMGIVHKEVLLESQQDVLIGYNKSSTIHYMKFRRKGQKRWGRYYGIDLVDPKDLKEIISILESKGVTVITKDLRADV